MKKEAQQQQTWTLWGSGIIVQAGTFIEYQSIHQVWVARVREVIISHIPPYPDAQVIHVKRYGPLRRQDGSRDDKVLPEKVLRVLDGPPSPAPKALTSLWSPRDIENPFRVSQSTLSKEAWRVTARWYPFSVRVLKVQDDKAIWYEQARTDTWHAAKETMQTLAKLHREKSLEYWVVMKCELRGKEGREKPVLWSPSQYTVERVIRGGLLPGLNLSEGNSSRVVKNQ